MNVAGSRSLATSKRDESTTSTERTNRPAPVIQRKLEVGSADDSSEREADRVADQVIRRLSSPAVSGGRVQLGTTGTGRIRSMGREGLPSDGARLPPAPRIQRMAGGGSAAGSFTAAPEIEARIAGSRGRGAPIEPRVRSRFEGAMDVDLGAVRVHQDGSADQLSRSMSAKAFTTGNDVFFSKGTYDPSSQGGQRLLAHELAHTVQQSGGVRRSVQRKVDGPLPSTIGDARARLKSPVEKGPAAHHQTTPGLQGKGHVDDDLVVLYEQAAVADPELRQKTTELAAATNGKPKFPPGLKGVDRAREKIVADYGGKTSEICDLVRSTIEFDSFPDMMTALDKCNAGFIKVVREKNRYEKPTPAGYRDICLNVQLSNGHIAELQMNLTQVLAAKDVGHKQYEGIRSIEARFAGLKIPLDMAPAFKKRVDKLLDESNDIYSKATEAAGGGKKP